MASLIKIKFKVRIHYSQQPNTHKWILDLVNKPRGSVRPALNLFQTMLRLAATIKPTLHETILSFLQFYFLPFRP